MQPHRSYPLIHTIHKERKKEAKKERKAATTTSTFLFDATSTPGAGGSPFCRTSASTVTTEPTEKAQRAQRRKLYHFIRM